MASPFKLLQESGLIRKNLIAFALLTAAINGMVTASVGAWLAQTYSGYQSRRASVQSISDLIYERRMRAGMVVSTMRRGADNEELRFRKRAYDEVFVEWNKKVGNNVLQIREVMGARETTAFETLMTSLLVPALAEMDACLTKGYDLKLAGQDPLPHIQACRYADLHQFSLDCAKGFTDELFAVTRLTFSPFGSGGSYSAAQQRVAAACTRPAGLPTPALQAVPIQVQAPSAPVPLAPAPAAPVQVSPVPAAPAAKSE